MEDSIEVKEKFAEVSKFQTLYTSGQQLYISHDGQYICGRAGEDGVEINVIGIDGRLVRKLPATEDLMVNFVVSSHNSTLLFASKSSLLTLWNWETGKALKRWKSGHSQLISCLALSPSNDRLAVGSSDRRLRLWRLSPDPDDAGGLFTAEPLQTMPCGSDMPTAAAFHPRLPVLATLTRAEAAVRLWSSNSGEPTAVLGGLTGEVTAVSFGRDAGRELVAGACQGKLFIVWDLETKAKVASVPTQEPLTSCVFIEHPEVYLKKTSDGPHVMTGGQSGVARLWSCSRSSCVLELRRKALEKPQSVLGKRKLPEEEEEAEAIEEKEADYSLRSITQIVDGAGDFRLVVRGSGSIEFLRKNELKVEQEWIANVGAVRRLLLAGPSSSPCLVALPSGSTQLLLYPRALQGLWNGITMETGHHGAVTDMAVSADGQHLLTASKDCTLRYWEVVEGASWNLKLLGVAQGHTAHVTAVAFGAPGGCLAFSCGQEVALIAWRLSGPLQLRPLATAAAAHKLEVNAVCAGPRGGLVATASRDKSVKVWKLYQESLALSCELRGHSKSVWSVCFAPTNHKLLSSSGDGTVKLWSLDDSTCLATFDHEGGPVYQALFCCQGLQFLSSDQSGILRLFTVKNQRSVQAIAAHEGRAWAIAVNRDESRLVTSSETGELTVWEDVSAAEREAQRAKLTEAFLVEDKIRNLVQIGNYRKALLFVLQTEMPEKTFNILRRLLRASPASLHSALRALLDAPAALSRLLRFCGAWAAHNRRLPVAKRVLAVLLSLCPPQRLLRSVEDPAHLLAGLMAHLQRQRDRERRCARAAVTAALLLDQQRPSH